MPGLLRNSQLPFTLRNYQGTFHQPISNFRDITLQNSHSNYPYPRVEEDDDDIDEEEDIEDEFDEPEVEPQEHIHNHELSELLDRILYSSQQRPSYTTERIEPRIRIREPFIRFGENDDDDVSIGQPGSDGADENELPLDHQNRNLSQ
eukprot:NODE_33_length_36935_cov_1.609241.p25 type:complete len:148 gc:universal NODE_33_length_36935_cov_1.609241:8365-7922(-)